MKISYLFNCFIALSFYATTCFSQGSNFRVAINTNVFGTGDTLQLQADYSIGQKKLPPATLDVIIKNERGNIWNIRWPLIDGNANGSIVISKYIPKGKYDIWLAVQPRVFRIYGQMVYCSRKKIKALETRMVAGHTHYAPQKIKLEPDGSFVINDWSLTNEMTLGFTTGNEEDVLHIHPECWLDSAYLPAAQSYVSVLVTDADTVVTAKSKAPALRPLAWSGSGVYSNLEPAEIYNQFFSKGMFRDTSEILIDVMGDSTVNAKTNTIQYITDKLLEHQIAVENRDNKLYVNGKELYFFYNESLTESSLSNIRLQGIAIIKLLSHYVSGTSENGHNLLAFYPKRYPFKDAGIAQNIFQIKGTDNETVLLR